MKNLTGLRRDSEILYVGTYDKDKISAGARGKLSDVFNKEMKNSETLSIKNGSIFERENLLSEQSSIFDRPGFGSFAFRYLLIIIYNCSIFLINHSLLNLIYFVETQLLPI